MMRISAVVLAVVMLGGCTGEALLTSLSHMVAPGYKASFIQLVSSQVRAKGGSETDVACVTQHLQQSLSEQDIANAMNTANDGQAAYGQSKPIYDTALEAAFKACQLD